MRFVMTSGECLLFRGGPKVNLAPRKLGHMSMSFRGVTYELKQEGSRIILDLPDKPPETTPHGEVIERPLGPGDFDILASHGFIAEGMANAATVERAVQEAVGSTDVKTVVDKENEARKAANPAAPPKKKVDDQPSA